jgi:nanoRNase/pAp phosphatase (c-di-AMP/oligoRNAs hydrolase)
VFLEVSVENMAKKKVEKLLAIAKGKKHALIMPHDYADPDAIGAALGLKTLLAEKLGLDATVSFSGVVGRQENRMLCEYLGLQIFPAGELDYDSYDLIAIVDCQPGTGNISLPDERQADIVIDHHPMEGDLDGVKFLDVRLDYGSSATIVTEYLLEAGVKIGKKLATALLYGIKTDAMNFTRKTKESDIKMYLALFNLIDNDALSRIESAGLPREYFQVLRTAVEDAGTYDDVLVSDLGELDNPGMIGELADLFLRAEGSGTVLCFGAYDGRLMISIRSLNPKVHAGRIIRYAVGRRGTAGGHATMAGGQIPLLKDTKKEEDEHRKAVLDKVFSKLSIKGKRKRKITRCT